MLWQRGYYEHVIRNEKALDRIRAYIAYNPSRWGMTRRISREWCVPKEGGFETRPYKPPDVCAASRKGTPSEFRNGLISTKLKVNASSPLVP